MIQVRLVNYSGGALRGMNLKPCFMNAASTRATTAKTLRDSLAASRRGDGDLFDRTHLLRTSLSKRANRFSRAVKPAPVRYAGSPEGQIAYQVVGDGPIDLVFATPRSSSGRRCPCRS